MSFNNGSQVFADRREAGSILAGELTRYAKNPEVLVLGLPRGGVVVAEEVAKKLKVPLDVLLLRKLPYPPQPELAMGAVAEDGTRWINEEFEAAARETPGAFENVVEEQMEIIRNRARQYRSHRHPHSMKGKIVILVDDGIATGATIKVAVQVARQAGAEKVVVAVPVAAPSSLREMEAMADEVVCLSAPLEFYAVGQAYHSFEQVSDSEVCRILDRNA